MSDLLKSINKAIRSGLDSKARSIIDRNYRYLSVNDTRSLLILAGKFDAVQVVDFILHISPFRDRFDPSQNDNAILWYACKAGHVNMVKILLEDKRVRCLNITHCVTLSIRFGHIEVVKVFLANGFDPSTNGNSAIRDASEYGRTDIVRLLLSDKRVDPSDYWNEAIIKACKKDHTDIVKLLLADNRVDPATFGSSFTKACKYGHIDIIKILLTDSRIDPSSQKNEGLKRAVNYNHPEIVKILLMIDHDIDQNVLQNLFETACLRDYIEIIHLLIPDKRIDLNAAFKRVCIYGKNSDIVKILLETGRIDPGVDNNKAIISACRNREKDIVSLLLTDPRVDPSADDNRALRFSLIWDSNTHITMLLLENEKVRSTLSSEDKEELKKRGIEI